MQAADGSSSQRGSVASRSRRRHAADSDSDGDGDSGVAHRSTNNDRALAHLRAARAHSRERMPVQSAPLGARRSLALDGDAAAGDERPPTAASPASTLDATVDALRVRVRALTAKLTAAQERTVHVQRENARLEAALAEAEARVDADRATAHRTAQALLASERRATDAEARAERADAALAAGERVTRALQAQLDQLRERQRAVMAANSFAYGNGLLPAKLGDPLLAERYEQLLRASVASTSAQSAAQHLVLATAAASAPRQRVPRDALHQLVETLRDALRAETERSLAVCGECVALQDIADSQARELAALRTEMFAVARRALATVGETSISSAQASPRAATARPAAAASLPRAKPASSPSPALRASELALPGAVAAAARGNGAEPDALLPTPRVGDGNSSGGEETASPWRATVSERARERARERERARSSSPRANAAAAAAAVAAAPRSALRSAPAAAASAASSMRAARPSTSPTAAAVRFFDEAFAAVSPGVGSAAAPAAATSSQRSASAAAPAPAPASRAPTDSAESGWACARHLGVALALAVTGHRAGERRSQLALRRLHEQCQCLLDRAARHERRLRKSGSAHGTPSK